MNATEHLVTTIKDAAPIIWLAWIFGVGCGLWIANKIKEAQSQ